MMDHCFNEPNCECFEFPDDFSWLDCDFGLITPIVGAVFDIRGTRNCTIYEQLEYNLNYFVKCLNDVTLWISHNKIVCDTNPMDHDSNDSLYGGFHLFFWLGDVRFAN